MSRANILNTGTASYLELIGNGKAYRVPPYQRDYAWTQQEWEDLWNDVVEMRGDPDGRHYMGALVVQTHGDREFFVIDGQQRLATISLLALAIIDKLRRMADAGVDAERNRERATELRNRFIGEKDPASLVESSRLRLNETDDPLYQDYLVQLRQPLNPRGLSGSNALLWKCFRYFAQQIDELEPGPGDQGEQIAKILSETVARRLLFILITVDDELNAYTLFETLNARGLELTTTDLLKNYFFSKARARADVESLKRRWQTLIATVTQGRFPDSLRYHLLCEHPTIRRQRLFAQLRPIYVDDEQFQSNFARWAVSTRGRRARVARYMLARLETDAGERAVDPETDPATVEHVLPENPGGEWAETFPPDRWEAAVGRVGNLTLLERALNRNVGNAGYPSKRAAYESSGYALTREIADLAPEEWTPALLDERQRRLAARAVRLWRVDFP